MRIGIDAGGTFTDFIVLHDDGQVETFKLRSNPQNPAKVILAGIERAAGKQEAEVVHGSTVATNALLERKGVRTAFITTEGFEDLIQIGRQNRPELYNLTPLPRRPLADRELCFGIGERTYFDGTVAQRPHPLTLRKLRFDLQNAEVRSIAICFLHSYQNAENEMAAARELAGSAYLSVSSSVSPEFREFERATTTFINAYVGPLMDYYLGELERSTRCSISIMQSNGGFLSAPEARRQAVRTVLSGPAGGVVGAIEMARLSGYSKALGFDMGGTSTDVSLSDGAPRETTEASIDGFPIRVPMLDIHTVGAGGGSIARVDEGGLLRVGPESAGADPGPACYGVGTQPTVTDAHVVLGRIAADQLAGGTMQLDVDSAAKAVDRIAARLGLSRDEAAAGILRVANANMERAIRVVSVERGHDPRDFALVAFGGCGGLHACEMAEELGLGTVLVPAYAGALSALGMLMADNVRDYAAGALQRKDVEKRFSSLEKKALREMPGAELERSADVRYLGQSYELNVPWETADPAAPFHAAHHRIYGYSNPGCPVEVVTVRVRARLRVPKPHLDANAVEAPSEPLAYRRVLVDGRWREIPVYQRSQVPADPRPGPALVIDYGSTTLVPSTWTFQAGAAGNLLCTRNREN